MARDIQIIGHAAPLRARQEARDELQKMSDSSQEVLASATTVWPLDFFPDTITVDRAQVTVTRRTFFWMGDVTSFRIEDILNVTAQVGPFFGSIKIVSRFFDATRPFRVSRFWRDDALRLQAIIQGLVIATKKDIDATAVEGGELVQEAERLGQPSGSDRP